MWTIVTFLFLTSSASFTLNLSLFHALFSSYAQLCFIIILRLANSFLRLTYPILLLTKLNFREFRESQGIKIVGSSLIRNVAIAWLLRSVVNWIWDKTSDEYQNNFVNYPAKFSLRSPYLVSNRDYLLTSFTAR